MPIPSDEPPMYPSGCGPCDAARAVVAELRGAFDPLDDWDTADMADDEIAGARITVAELATRRAARALHLAGLLARSTQLNIVSTAVLRQVQNLSEHTEKVRQLCTPTVDAVIADPPYNSGGRTASERRSQRPRDKYVSGDAEHDLPDFTGDNRDQRGYVAWLALVLAGCLRTTVEGGHLLVFSDWRQVPATSDALQAAGWIWQGTLVWSKPLSRPRRGGFKSAAEYILWGTKGRFDSSRELYLPGVYSASQPRGRQRRHITQKPVAGLLDELVQIAPDRGTILDPFTGSGSTGVAAISAGRLFVGIELSERYYRIAEERLADCAGQLDKRG